MSQKTGVERITLTLSWDLFLRAGIEGAVAGISRQQWIVRAMQEKIARINAERKNPGGK